MKKILFTFLIFKSIISFSQKKLSIFELNDSLSYYLKKRNLKKFKILIDKSKELNLDLDNKYKLIDKNRYYYYYIINQNDSCKNI